MTPSFTNGAPVRTPTTGQKHDPVIIMNLVAPKTREGRVLQTLLEKLERIRKELRSDKVFDVIGRLFEGVSIKQYMEMAVDGRTDEATNDLNGKLTKEQVEALLARERNLYDSGGDVASELPRLREDIEHEAYRRLLPGYVRQYVERAAPFVGVELTGDPGGCFGLRSADGPGADPLLNVLDTYPESMRECLSFVRPADKDAGVWVHPGEPLFEAFRGLVSDRLADQALRGAVFIDPTAEKPYLFHLALVTVVRQADPELPDLATEDVLECRLVGVKQFEGSQIHVCPVEHLLLLKGGHGLPGSAQRLAAGAKDLREQARAFLVERVAREMAVARRDALLATLPEREGFVQRGFDFQEAEYAASRTKQSEKARAGNAAAQKELGRIKDMQRGLALRKQETVAVLRREPELIAPRAVQFIAHALVVPSTDPADREDYDAKAEQVAMSLAWAFEESEGAIVKDVHTPELARAAGLSDNPGFDLLSMRPKEKRSIEVKGRAGVGEVEVSANEWARACNLRGEYWLYVVYNCATPNGGDGVLPWRLVPVFRQFAKSLAVLIPYHAYSAATILALGANEIVMHPFGVLGPIDPTVTNPFNPPNSQGRLIGISVEDVKAYINFVKETVGITHEDELVKMLEILAEKVHPLALGNVERFISQSRMIARKLLKTHVEDHMSERDIEDIIENLASKLYFHGHPINRTEAEKELRLKVAKEVPADLEDAMWRLYTDFEAEFRNREPFQPIATLSAMLAPWAAPAPAAPPGPPPAPVIQVVHQTFETPLTIVESGVSSSVQKASRRFTLVSQFGKQDEVREELLSKEWTRTPAPAP